MKNPETDLVDKLFPPDPSMSEAQIDHELRRSTRGDDREGAEVDSRRRAILNFDKYGELVDHLTNKRYEIALRDGSCYLVEIDSN